MTQMKIYFLPSVAIKRRLGIKKYIFLTTFYIENHTVYMLLLLLLGLWILPDRLEP